MEIEEINHRSCKRSRVGNGKLQPGENHQDEDEEDGEAKGERNNINNNNNTASASNSNSGRMVRPCHHSSSRIIRVSRSSGGKDRHSKVITAKGLRDRRVRLSVSTAIQFYDLQDRLGYDQPSKAIEWLIKAAASAIAELPSLDTNFPEPPMDHHHHQQLNMEQPMQSDSGMDPDADPSYNQQQHSSTSETSKGSVLSLSRSESRVRARERAKERVMDKKKDRDDAHVVSHHQNVADPTLNSQGSFTKLLTGGSSSAAAVTATAGQASSSTANLIQKQMQQNLPPATSTADYFGMQSSLFGQQLPPQLKAATSHQSSTSGFSSQAHFGNSFPIGMVPLISGNAGDGHPGTEMQQFAFLQDHFFPVAAAAAAASGGDYYLNFSISPSLAGFHRGTLQSNSPAHHHQHQLSHHHHQHHQGQAQRLSSALDGSSVPFFFGGAAPSAASSPAENPYASGFEGHLQLCEGYKHLEVKGKGKS